MSQNPFVNSLFPFMVNFGAMNIWGLNPKPKQDSVHDLICKKNLSFVGIVETRVKAYKANSIAKTICKKWKWNFNYDHHINGRIWVGWDPASWNVSVINMSSQFIHCYVSSVDLNVHTFVTTIYGLHTDCDRRLLWRDLRSLAASVDNAWCIMGDFNEV